MRVAVFGATGGTGRQLVRQALALGHQVTVLARRPDAVAERDERLRVLAGDVLAPECVAPVVAEADAVISALGIGFHRWATTVYSQGTGNVIDAMKAAGSRRLLCVSTSSLVLPPVQRPAEYAVGRMLHAILRAPYADMALMEDRVTGSGLDWTLLRAARLTNGAPTGRYRTASETKLAGCWSISRADVAGYLLANLDTATTFQRCVEIAY
ncbi:MAG TPA: NAD(P)H-binding protein [Pseudonocardiaceae bacterium]|jgi:putative NADH-flavin reductase|nr:NAD(P)H-binding protein [Pseudonocardiaceae bacterium]